MKTGKLPEHTFKRSVMNPIRYQSADTAFRSAIGHDGAVIGDMVTAMATTAFSYTGNELYAWNNAMNNVIAAGGKPYAATVAVMLPEHSDEATLRKIMDQLYHQGELAQIDIVAGHTELIPSVNAPTIAVTMFGKRIWENRHKEVGADFDVVMTKWTGIYGGALLASLKEDEIVSRYPKSYVEKAAAYMKDTSLLPELSVIEKLMAQNDKCIYAAHDVSNGGLFGALWQLMSACNCGVTVSLDSIYMKQEIIEVCEFFDINPYMMNGQGSLLLITKDGEALVEHFRDEGIAANIIGKTTASKDRKIIIGEEERFLVPPKGDALNVVFYGQKMQI